MNLQQAQLVRSLIMDSYEGYMKTIRESPEKRINLPVKSAPWNPGMLVHASQLGGCHKKAALRHFNKYKEKFSLASAQRQELGTLLGNFFSESIIWGLDATKDNWKLAGDFDFDRERRIKRGVLCGQIDVALLHGMNEVLPVECKLTNSWSFDWEQRKGMTLPHLLQVIAYMRLADSNFGYLVDLFDGLDAPESMRVHLVQYRAEYATYTVLDQNDLPIQTDSKEFPKNSVGQITITDDYLSELIETHYQALRTASERNIVPNPYPGPFQYPCSVCKAPKYYQKAATRYENGKNVRYEAGDLMPGTGIMKNLCPALAICWPVELRDVGYLGGALPDTLDIEMAEPGNPASGFELKKEQFGEWF